MADKQTINQSSSLQLYHGDCLKLMPKLPNHSIDFILADLPYGATNAKWDSVIPLKPLWEQYKRIIKNHGCIALFGVEPFSSNLIMSNLKMYRYNWIWHKTMPTQFLNVHRRPLANYEEICIFYKHLPTYNPQMTRGKPYKKTKSSKNSLYNNFNPNYKTINHGIRFPTNCICFSNTTFSHRYHPTQKPVPLLEYLIRTYTNSNMLVLDNTMGSGSTGVACKLLHRHFIGMELNQHYYNVAVKRIQHAHPRLKQNDLF